MISVELKQKTLKGLFWSFVDNFAKLGVQFVVGIILARLLSPREFGLIGMLTIFIAVSQAFVDSGFGRALIRKKSCSSVDYSTVFYFNMVVAIVLYLALFFSAGFIASFFDEPELELLVKVLGLGIILNSFAIIQHTILTRDINFRVQANVTVIASVGSGAIAITMAALGFGVWSLVVLTLSRFFLNSLFLWVWSNWKPDLIFSKDSFTDLFSFGSKLMLSSLIDTAYQNIYLLVIGKYFSASDLGYYTRADQFRKLPSQNIMAVINRVSYPVLSSIQDEHERLKTNYQKLIRSTMFVTFVLMLGMAAVAKPMIITLIGEKWLPSVSYLQLLCFVGMFYPLQALNLNMLNVKGRSDIFLKLEIIKKIFAVPVIIVGVIWGIHAMILGMIIQTLIAYYLNSYYSGRFIGYSTLQQVKDVLPSFIFALAINAVVYSLNYILSFEAWTMLIIEIALGGILVITLGELLRMKDYLYLKNIIKEQLVKKR